MSQIHIIPEQDRADAINRLSELLVEAFPRKRIEVTVRRQVSQRSTQQNRWLHGVAYRLLADATGYERDDIAEYLCGRFFGWKTVRTPKTPHCSDGLRDAPVRTTTRDEYGRRDVLTTQAFDEFKEFIQRFGARHGVLIPDPDPLYWLPTEPEAE